MVADGTSEIPKGTQGRAHRGGLGANLDRGHMERMNKRRQVDVPYDRMSLLATLPPTLTNSLLLT